MNVLLVDDDCLVSTALKIILEADPNISVAGIGNDGLEACHLYSELKPDILLMDIRMKHMNGLEAAAKILAEYKDARILLLTTFLDDEYIIKALKLGAKGYLLKQDYNSIIPSLHAVMMGQTVFGDEIISKLPQFLSQENHFCYKDYQINEKEGSITNFVG